MSWCCVILTLTLGWVSLVHGQIQLVAGWYGTTALWLSKNAFFGLWQKLLVNQQSKLLSVPSHLSTSCPSQRAGGPQLKVCVNFTKHAGHVSTTKPRPAMWAFLSLSTPLGPSPEAETMDGRKLDRGREGHSSFLVPPLLCNQCNFPSMGILLLQCA